MQAASQITFTMVDLMFFHLPSQSRDLEEHNRILQEAINIEDIKWDKDNIAIQDQKNETYIYVYIQTLAENENKTNQ